MAKILDGTRVITDNLGLGISPLAKLHIEGDDELAGTLALRIDNDAVQILEVRNNGDVYNPLASSAWGLGVIPSTTYKFAINNTTHDFGFRSLNNKSTGNTRAIYAQSNISKTGVAQTIGVLSDVTGAGASSTNIAGWFAALNGGSNNYGIINPSGSGDNGFGLTIPTAKVHIRGASSGTGTFSLQCENSASVLSLQVRDDGSVYNNGPGAVITNTVFGVNALKVSTGIGNAAYGYEAGLSVTTGQANNLIGYQAGRTMTIGSYNVAIGRESQRNATSTGNISLGYYTLRAATGGFNVAIGHNTGPVVSSGQFNIYIGSEAGKLATTGSNNIALGFRSIQNVTTGFGLIAIGASAGNALTLARSSVIIGASAAGALTGSQANTSFNTILGDNAMATSTLAVRNVIIGGNSALSHTGTLTGNTIIGFQAGFETPATTYQHSIAIGRNAQITADNQCQIGNYSSGAFINDYVFGGGDFTGSITSGNIVFRLTSIETSVDQSASSSGWLFEAAAGTGTAAGGDLKLKTALPSGVSSGTTNTHSDGLTVSGTNDVVEIHRVLVLPEFTVVTAPTTAATGAVTGGVIIVTDETGGRTMATYDGANWKRVSDGATIA